MNRATIIGNLGQDPESRSLSNGGRVVNFTVATNERWVDKSSGERKERTEWHRVVIFNDKLGELATRFLHKGDRALVEGELRTRKWTDQQGAERYMTEIVMQNFRGNIELLGGGGSDRNSRENDSAPSNGVNGQSNNQPGPSTNSYADVKGREPPFGSATKGYDVGDDDIPF
jgi:single-strand DNA-binding protein